MEEIKVLDVKVVAALIGICGILVAAIISSFGYLFKTRVETKKSARKVLYLLLEIRISILNSLNNPEDATKSYFEYFGKKLIDKGIPVNPSEIKGPMVDIVQSHFQNIFSTMRTDIHERLLVPFEEALLDFATVKPVLAYRLRGKEKFVSLIQHANNHLQNLEEHISEEVDQDCYREILLRNSDNLNEDSISEIIELLDEDIFLLAKHCSAFDYKDCKQVLLNKKFEPNKYDFTKLDVIIDKIFIEITEADNKPIQQTP